MLAHMGVVMLGPSCLLRPAAAARGPIIPMHAAIETVEVIHSTTHVRLLRPSIGNLSRYLPHSTSQHMHRAHCIMLCTARDIHAESEQQRIRKIRALASEQPKPDLVFPFALYVCTICMHAYAQNERARCGGSSANRIPLESNLTEFLQPAIPQRCKSIPFKQAIKNQVPISRTHPRPMDARAKTKQISRTMVDGAMMALC